MFRKQFLEKAKQQIQEKWGEAVQETGGHVLTQYTRNLTENEQNDLIDEALDYVLKDKFSDVHMRTLLQNARRSEFIPNENRSQLIGILTACY